MPPTIVQAYEALPTYYYEPDTISALAVLPALEGRENRDCHRSERREAHMALMQAIAVHVHLIRLLVCVPQADGKLGNVTMLQLAPWSGLSLRRTERAMRDLAQARLVTLIEQREYDAKTGEYRSVPAIRRVSPLFFAVLGLSEQLQHDRDYMKRRQKKAEKDGLAAQIEHERRADHEAQREAAREAVGQQMLRGLLTQVFDRTPSVEVPPAADTDANYRRRRNELGLQLRHEHPEWTTEKLYAELARMVPPPPRPPPRASGGHVVSTP